MDRVKSFWAGYNEVPNFEVQTYRCCQKENDQLKKMNEFNEPFFIREMAAKYNMPYKTLRGPILGAWERYIVHAAAQTLICEQEKIITFQLNRIGSD